MTSANSAIFEHIDFVENESMQRFLVLKPTLLLELKHRKYKSNCTIAAVASDLSTANNDLSIRITNVANDLASANSTLDTKIDTIYNTLTANLNTANTTLHTRIDGIDADFEDKLRSIRECISNS